MDAALVASAAMLGLAGTPHCAAMCGAPCAAVAGPRGAPLAVFLVARLAGYAAVGAAASASVGLLASMAQWTPALRPLWVLFHAAMLLLGLWLLWQGRQPAWLATLGRVPEPAAAGGGGVIRFAAAGMPAPPSPPRRLLPASLAGLAWVAWPCGLLQSALLVAAMTSTATGGAAAMGAFALASSAGLVLAPRAWRALAARTGGERLDRGLARAAGAMLVLAAGFALGHGLWAEVAAFCGLA